MSTKRLTKKMKALLMEIDGVTIDRQEVTVGVTWEKYSDCGEQIEIGLDRERTAESLAKIEALMASGQVVPMGGYLAGWGAWVLRPGYVGRSEWSTWVD